MKLKILKKDLKRKKSVNIILLIFVMLATVFVAGSINNLIVIAGGQNAYFDMAGIKDYIIVSNMIAYGEETNDSTRRIEAFLGSETTVIDYSTDDFLFAAENQFESPQNQNAGTSFVLILNCFDISQQKFFDEKNREITEMEDGTIYLSLQAMENNGFKKGDRIILKTDSFQKEFEIAGYAKDAFLGSDLMGAERYLFSENDFKLLMEEGGLPHGKLYQVSSSDVRKFEEAYESRGLDAMLSGGRAYIKNTYTMDMVMGAVLLLSSLCLIVIAVIVLRFTIIFTVNEDYREIGIMKAIGIHDFAIRKLYLMKYLVITTLGAMLGFAVSIPFSSFMLASAMKNMVLEDGSSIVLQLLLSVLVVVVVVFFAYCSTGRIKHCTPMDAIRSGNNGERFKKKGIFSLHGRRMSVTSFMAVNDVLTELKKYMMLMLAGTIGVWLVAMLANSINTLRSDGIAAWFGMPACDIVLSNESEQSRIILENDKQAYYDWMDEIRDTVEAKGYKVSNVALDIGWGNINVKKDEKSCNVTAFQGLGSDINDYMYDRGTAPQYENEIAITHLVAEKIDADIGDTVYIKCRGEENPYVVTAVYQSMNNMGIGIRFSENTQLDYGNVAMNLGVRITFAGDLSDDEIEKRIDIIQAAMPDYQVRTLREFIDQQLGSISDRLISLKYLMLGIAVGVNILIVVLMQKMFLIREQGEMGMLKAIGFSNRDIIWWQTKRIILVLFIGILAGMLTGTPFSQITIGQVFKLMGATRMEFEINTWEVYLLYPAVIFVASVLACMLTMLKVRRISAQEMGNIE